MASGVSQQMMDALGVELEDTTVREVGALIEPTGWSTGRHPVGRAERPTPSADGDSLGLKLGVLRFLPSALALDRRWTKGVPGPLARGWRLPTRADRPRLPGTAAAQPLAR
jgi:hypothetical protein